MADSIPYPDAGTENPVTYTFKASTTGDVVAYFDGSGASFNEDIGLLVNGKDTGITGLANHSSSMGSSLDFGSIAAGSALTFLVNVQDYLTGKTSTYYSTPSLNPGGSNQIYSTAYAGGSAIPAGTYVGFEDENPKNDGSSDFNYTDEQFVVTNVATAVSSAPEPSIWVLMIAGVGMVGASLRFGRRRSALTEA